MQAALLAILLISISSALAVSYPPNMCYVALWNNGGNVQQQFPLRKDSLTAVQYYAYNKAGGNASSANTPDRLEVKDGINYFFYESGNQLSIFFIFDQPNDGSGGHIEATIGTEGVAGKGASIILKDDEPDTYTFNTATGVGSISTTWADCCTDGTILGNLPRPPTLPSGQFNPTDYTFCVNLQFPKDTTIVTGVNRYIVRSLPNYYENGGRIQMFGNNLNNTQIAPASANSLKMCYTQCKCNENDRLLPTKGSFNSHEVVFGPTGGLNLYRAGSYCTWIMNYTNVTGISFFWSEFKFAQDDEDVVSFYWNTVTVKPTADVVYPRTNDTRDWTTSIAASKTVYPTTSPNSFNAFRSAIIYPESTNAQAFVAFHSADDSPAHQPGFNLYYIVIPLLESLSKTVIVPAGGETITINGYNYLNSNTASLKCGWYWSGADTPDLVQNATFVSANVVTCKTPAFVDGRISDLLVAVSNDGGYFYSNELQLTYEICGDAIKIGKESCDDGNTESGDGCSDKCLVEPGWICPGCGAICNPLCGDSVLVGSETCDDGNAVAGDGCSDKCQIEPGYECVGLPSNCTSICGDGYKTPAEECDDGNLRCGDGCSDECELEVGWNCPKVGKPCHKN